MRRLPVRPVTGPAMSARAAGDLSLLAGMVTGLATAELFNSPWTGFACGMGLTVLFLSLVLALSDARLTSP